MVLPDLQACTKFPLVMTVPRSLPPLSTPIYWFYSHLGNQVFEIHSPAPVQLMHPLPIKINVMTMFLPQGFLMVQWPDSQLSGGKWSLWNSCGPGHSCVEKAGKPLRSEKRAHQGWSLMDKRGAENVSCVRGASPFCSHCQEEDNLHFLLIFQKQSKTKELLVMSLFTFV